MTIIIRLAFISLFTILTLQSVDAAKFSLDIQQITHGPNHHFFGYIGHVQTIPWNGTNRYILSLRTDFQEHPPTATDVADIVLIDTHNDFSTEKIEETRAWNFQQGTMMYWNPEQPNTQFFFNDRDPKTNKVFCVLYDIAKRERVKEFRFEDTPIGNGGVAQNGGYFLGINYARMARLRPVTGYAGAYDWTVGVDHPSDDGIFKINTNTGEKQLIVSFEKLANVVRDEGFDVEGKPFFINHTLWNRNDDRIYFYARANFDNRGERVDVPFTMKPDGSDLTAHGHYGGHPEWDEGYVQLGSKDKRMVRYDTEQKKVIEVLGDEEIFPNPGGDNAISPDGKWIVGGYGSKSDFLGTKDGFNAYTVYRRSDGAYAQTPKYSRNGYHSGELRVDQSPCWDRTSSQILFPAFGDDGTRQLFVMKVIEE